MAAADWSVVLPPELAATARTVTREVASRLRDPERLRTAVRQSREQTNWPESAAWRPSELAGGHAGLAVLFSAFAAEFPAEDWDVAAQAHAEVAVEASAGVDAPGLFHGLAGLAFAASGQDIVASLEGRLLARVDAAADRLDPAGMAVGDFDVVSGLAGSGAYLLRRPVPALERILAAFVRVSRLGDPARVWHTPPDLLDEAARERHPHGSVNCGLAHGVPGPLALLALAEKQGVQVEGVQEAIERLATWLAEQRVKDEWGWSWPYSVPTEPDQPPTRTAWCYGTPGVARSLWLAGAALDEPAYRDLAIAAMEAVYRRPVTERRIDSPTFCHGVAGLLQVTLRFAHDTGLPLFRDAGAELAGQLIEAYDPDSLFGYRNLEPGDCLVDRAEIVEGAAGVALVLLGASSAVEPDWDRMFLLS